MTLDEKVSALSTSPDVPRLGIQGSGHIEGLHGVCLWRPRRMGRSRLKPLPTTQFPQSVGLGEPGTQPCCNKALQSKAYEARYIFRARPCTQTGRKRRAIGAARASSSALQNADLARDPRWGRSEESYGEDPYLVGTMAVALVRGLQGGRSTLLADGFAHESTSPPNSNENGRRRIFLRISTDRLLREYYSVPFRMGVTEAVRRAYMTAYNAYNGIDGGATHSCAT